jgi:serine/threonine protein kinase
MFPGKDSLNQLEMIFSVLGTPSEEDLGFIDNPRALKYIKSLPYTPSIPPHMLYPSVNPLAVNLLLQMLAFDPRKRLGWLRHLHILICQICETQSRIDQLIERSIWLWMRRWVWKCCAKKYGKRPNIITFN